MILNTFFFHLGKMAPHSSQFCVWQPTVCSAEVFYNLRASCNFPEGVEPVVPSPEENHKRVSSGFCCAYTSYFSSCRIHFPLPKLLVEYLFKTRLCLSQLCPNFLRQILGLIKLAFNSGYSLQVRILFVLGP